MKTDNSERKVSLVPQRSQPTLLELLASLEPLNESFPEIEDLPLDDIDYQDLCVDFHI
jgi:hypothetical protein